MIGDVGAKGVNPSLVLIPPSRTINGSTTGDGVAVTVGVAVGGTLVEVAVGVRVDVAV